MILKFSIVLYSPNNIIHLRKCLDGLMANYLNSAFPIIIMLPGDDETTIAFLKTYKERNSLDLLEFHAEDKNTTLAKARNNSIQYIKTPYVGFLCDTVEVSEHYLLKALDIIKTHKPDVFGGPQVTHPESSRFQHAVGEILTSQLANGPQNMRHALKNKYKTSVVKANENNLSSCNIWLKTPLLIGHGLKFDERLTRNSERVLVFQLEKLKRTILFCSDLYVYGQRSTNLWVLARDTYLSARYLSYSFFLYPKSLNLTYIIPIFLLAYLIAVPFIVSTPLIYALYMYAFALLYFSFKVCANSGKFLNLPLNILFHLTMNLSYAVGVITPLFKRPKTR